MSNENKYEIRVMTIAAMEEITKATVIGTL